MLGDSTPSTPTTKDSATSQSTQQHVTSSEKPTQQQPQPQQLTSPAAPFRVRRELIPSKIQLMTQRTIMFLTILSQFEDAGFPAEIIQPKVILSKTGEEYYSTTDGNATIRNHRVNGLVQLRKRVCPDFLTFSKDSKKWSIVLLNQDLLHRLSCNSLVEINQPAASNWLARNREATKNDGKDGVVQISSGSGSGGKQSDAPGGNDEEEAAVQKRKEEEAKQKQQQQPQQPQQPHQPQKQHSQRTPIALLPPIQAPFKILRGHPLRNKISSLTKRELMFLTILSLYEDRGFPEVINNPNGILTETGEYQNVDNNPELLDGYLEGLIQLSDSCPDCITCSQVDTITKWRITKLNQSYLVQMRVSDVVEINQPALEKWLPLTKQVGVNNGGGNSSTQKVLAPGSVVLQRMVNSDADEGEDDEDEEEAQVEVEMEEEEDDEDTAIESQATKEASTKDPLQEQGNSSNRRESLVAARLNGPARVETVRKRKRGEEKEEEEHGGDNIQQEERTRFKTRTEHNSLEFEKRIAELEKRFQEQNSLIGNLQTEKAIQEQKNRELVERILKLENGGSQMEIDLGRAIEGLRVDAKQRNDGFKNEVGEQKKKLEDINAAVLQFQKLLNDYQQIINLVVGKP